MLLDLGKLGAIELKELDKAVKAERDRRGKKNPSNHDSPTWVLPSKAVLKQKETVAYTVGKTKTLSELTAADIPRGLSPEDVASDYP